MRGGIAAAHGKFIVMGDADESYDFMEAGNFAAKLREGFDLVQGCRLPAGGGKIMPEAMPFSHRWLGNPMFSLMARHMFAAPVHDVYCGLRGFTKELYQRLELQCEGMEFATEMIIKASLHGARIAEIPITLHPDGRKAHAPHLRTIRDGWRTLRFFLVFSPRWLFLIPGFALGLLGAIGYTVALPGLKIGGVTFDAHTLLFSSLAILMGYQSILFAILAKTFAINEGLLPKDPHLDRFFKVIYLERGLAIGALAFLAGLSLLVDAVSAMEGGTLRPPRLRRHHALGDSRCDTGGAWIPDDPFGIFCQHPRHETSTRHRAGAKLIQTALAKPPGVSLNSSRDRSRRIEHCHAVPERGGNARALHREGAGRH